MKKSITLSKYILKKNLKEIFSFSIILFIATILFASAIVLNNNIDKDYDDEFNKLNTANNFFTISNMQYTADLLQNIENIKGVKEVEIRKGIMLTVPIYIGDSKQEQNQVFYNIDDNSNISQYKVINETSESIENPIYLSNYTSIHSNLNIKDKYEFEIDSKTYSFYIKGIINEMQYGNYTSSVIAQYVENEQYNNLLHNNENKEVVTLLIKSDESHKTYNSISKYLSSNNINILNKNYDEQVKNQRLSICNIIVLILILFSGIMLIISLFVSKFKIGQSITEEITNMGVLKALGYTSNEIILSTIFPFIICGLIFTICGISASYLLLPLLSLVVEMQSGFIWNIQLDLTSNLMVLCINLILICIFTVIPALKIKKLNPINAIRGLNEKKSGKNFFNIEYTIGNINFILMLKNFINTKKQNILLGIVLFFMTLVSSFAGTLFYNINLNPINFINTLVEEHPSVIVEGKKELKNKIINLNNVKNVIYYDENITIDYKENNYKTFVAESFTNLDNDLCYEGHNPRNSDEISIGSKIKEENNINLGDYIVLNKNQVEHEYKVVGFIQSVNYSGEIMEMTLEGYNKLDASYIPNIMYVYLDDEEKSEDFIKELNDMFGQDINQTMNYTKSMNSAINMYVSLISTICIIIIILTILLICLILYILISSIIIKRKQELGIFKAIGYENKQLVKQLVGGFIPSTIISTVLGLIVSQIFMKDIVLIMFRNVGAYKVSFEYPFIIFIMITMLLILITLIIGVILARKIRKISVYSLIKE